MTILVIGATGKTGRLVVERLLTKNHLVRVVVRASHRLSAEVLENPNTTVIETSVLDLTDQEMAEHVKDCDVVVSCLGHVPNFNGMFAEPKRLCTDATQRLCNAIEQNGPPSPTRFILMNTVAVQNPDLDEKRTWFERGLLTLLRHILPPHRDNETASAYLYRKVGRENQHIEWCSVRPDSLIDAERSPYDINHSPTTGIRRPADNSRRRTIERRPLHDRADRQFRALEEMDVRSSRCRSAGAHERETEKIR